MANLKNINLMSQDTFESIEQVDDELYAVSASGIGFPSNKFDELTLGADGAKYTAPANGYFSLNSVASNTPARVNIFNTQNSADSQAWVTVEGNAVNCFLPVLKGDVVAVTYYNIKNTVFRFIYAEGE